MSVPKLRFKEFITEWKYLKLKEIAAKESKKNNGAEITLVLTNSATQGIINQSDYFDRDIANKNNLNGYYIVKNNSFIYNPRISNFAPVGPVKRNHLQTGVMSPLYTVFHFFGQVDLDFMEIYFNTNKWHFYLQSIANYGVRSDRMNISSEGFFNMPIKLPIIKEQEKIASFFTVIDQKLNLLKEKKEKLELYKKGVMQQIFSRKLRFKDEKGNEFPEWEEKKLGEVGSLINGLTYSPTDINPAGILVLRSSNVKSRKLVFNDNVFVNASSFNAVQGNDILICVRNGSKNLIGKNALIPQEIGGVAFGAFMSVYRSKFNNFIFHWFDSYQYYKIINQNLGATINSINNGDLKMFKIPFPSFPEQKKIADFLSALDTKINLVSTQIEKTELWKKGLLQQMFV